MSINAVKNFYKFTFQNEDVQKYLMKTSNTKEFSTLCVQVAEQFGYIFSKEEMDFTITPLKDSNASENIDFGSPWINKIMEIGWTPLGYSRL